MRKLSILGLIGLAVIINGLAFAQEESISLTTYYPAPYGVYREMRSQRMAIGDTYYDSTNVCWEGDGTCSSPIPTGLLDPDVDLVVEGNVGIGTTNPSERLEVSGKIKLPQGTISETGWPDGSYCIFANGACPPGFSRHSGHMRAISLFAATPSYIKQVVFGDSNIKCHGACGQYGNWIGELNLAICCK